MIDKTKAYRFRGDSERWEFLHATGISQDWWCVTRSINVNTADRHHSSINALTAEHLHSRGILLEYPELPGEDWEFCEGEDAEKWLDDGDDAWWSIGSYIPEGCGIYCRKKKPVYRSGVIKGRQEETIATNGEAIYWTTDPERGKELLK